MTIVLTVQVVRPVHPGRAGSGRRVRRPGLQPGRGEDVELRRGGQDQLVPRHGPGGGRQGGLAGRARRGHSHTQV